MRWSDVRQPGRRYHLSELWAYRELVAAFVIRDLHVRYRQTVVGVAWVVIQPVMYMLVFSGFFYILGRRTSDSLAPNPLLILSGAILWQTFAQGVQQATLCLANNRSLLTKTYFPRLLLPIAAVSTPLIDFAIGWCVLFLATVCSGVPLRWSMLATPLAGLLIVCVTISVGVWVSMLNALYRDVASLVSFALPLGLFATPVMFQTSEFIRNETYRTIAALNPLVTIIDLFRAGWFGQPLPSLSMAGVSLLSTGVVFALGLKYFTLREDVVADRV